jgi:hypothetical protein
MQVVYSKYAMIFSLFGSQVQVAYTIIQVHVYEDSLLISDKTLKASVGRMLPLLTRFNHRSSSVFPFPAVFFLILIKIVEIPSLSSRNSKNYGRISFKASLSSGSAVFTSLITLNACSITIHPDLPTLSRYFLQICNAPWVASTRCLKMDHSRILRN